MTNHRMSKRGRPAGQMTRAKRAALDYVVRQAVKDEPIILGEMMRVCGFSCRSNAKRTLKALRDMGAIN